MTYAQDLFAAAKWIHHIKCAALHRQVMKSLQPFIDEDDMDFEEAAETAECRFHCPITSKKTKGNRRRS